MDSFSWDERIKNLENEVLQLTNKTFALQQNILNLQNERDFLYHFVQEYENSTCWRLTRPIRLLGQCFRYCYNLLERMHVHYKVHGLKRTLLRIAGHQQIEKKKRRQSMQTALAVQDNDSWKAVSDWIDNTPHEFIDIFSVPMGWNTPLFQRFQHLSMQAGNAGGISFYGANPSVDTDVLGYKFVTPTLCIVNLENQEIYNRLFQILDTKAGLKYIRIQSIDLSTTIEQIKDFRRRGYVVIYEYIDEISSQITGKIPEFVYQRHKYILQHEEIIAIATSDKLFEQLQSYRSGNIAMINNGVDYGHWHIDRDSIQCPQDLRPVLAEGKKIIAYHGALAQWIDYTLLKRIAEDQRFVLLLIGHEHDSRLRESGLLEIPSVYYLGAKSYKELSKYATFYDVAILPFKLNDITLSVSPVKIFEYMAAQKPIVSYALPECLKYPSCLCANTQEEFLDLIDHALNLRTDKKYIKQLNDDALSNTWTEIAKKTVELAREQYKRDLCKRNGVIESDVVNHDVSNLYRDTYLNDLLNYPKLKNNSLYSPITQSPYMRKDGDCKIVAYYLTQYHPDPHNEAWWGRGVTEWNNVVRAVPQYVGHYQPRIPGELGYYDLRIVDNMKRQVELARMYAIYGFSFYYYWFDGERLLERPLEMFLEHGEINFPFSLCWANENWTKRFDGTNTDILMMQPNSIRSYKNVIQDVCRFFLDPRYIRVDGRFMLTVYRPSLMPNPQKILDHWRTYCRVNNIGELYLIAVKENMVETDWLKEGYDAVTEFHPGTLYTNCLNITNQLQYIRKDFKGEVYSYRDIVMNKKYFKYNYKKLYRAVMPMWDNTARRDNKGMIFQGSSPELYKEWLSDVIEAGGKRDDLEDNIIFINAWNEWGEGAYLEPDKKYGYAYLEATKDAVINARKRLGKLGEDRWIL